MDNLITPRLDYIHFIHVLCLFFTAGFSIYTFKNRGQLRWLWLALFAVSYALSIVFLMLLRAAPSMEVLENLAASMSALSLFFLSLFGLHSIWKGKLRGLGYAVAATFMVLPAACAMFLGLEGFIATTRLGLGPLAGGLVLFGVFWMARNENNDDFVGSFFPLLGVYAFCLAVLPAVHLLVRGAIMGSSTLLTSLPQGGYAVGFAALSLALCTAYARSITFQNQTVESGEVDNRSTRNGEARRKGAMVAYAYGVAAVGLAVFLGFSITEIMGASAEESMRTELFMRVSAVGNALHPSEVDALLGEPKDVDSPAYKRLLRQLTRIRIVNPDLRFIYMTDMHLPSREIFFLLDTESPSSEDYVAPGVIYEEAPEELVNIFSTGKAQLVGPYSDRWGFWISGMAPIKHDTGKIAGVIGMDIHATKFIANVASARLTGIVISFLLAIIGAGVGLIVQRNQMLALVNITLREEVEQRVLAEGRLRGAKRTAEEASQAKSDFLARMSHEIRTPMTVMLGVGDLLSEADLDEEQAELVELFRNTGDGLLLLINDILDLSKVEAGRLDLVEVQFDLYEMVEKSVAVMQLTLLEKNVSLTWGVGPGTPRWVLGDVLHLRQVLVNLLGNAVKFTQEGEIGVYFGLAATQPDDGRIELQFSVRDTGVGVPSDKLDHIFERFAQADPSTTRRYGGTGLGLTICKSLVELMDGEISVQSVEGMGTTFTFTARLRQSEPPVDQADDVVETSDEAKQQPAKVLLVEDSEAIQLLVNYYLRDTGHTFLVAGDGEAGLRKFAEGDFDLVLMDLEMPVMDGFEACARMRHYENDNDLAPTPIVALTAYAYDEYAEKCQQSGFTTLITKPFKRAEILRCISELVRPAG